MQEAAIKKIKAEMEKDKDPYVQVIGNLLLDHINMNPDNAEKILSEGKTITKSIDEMASIAKKKAVNGRAMLTDQEGFEIVLKYFGIEGKVTASSVVINPIIQEQVKEKLKTAIDFDVNLDDLLK